MPRPLAVMLPTLLPSPDWHCPSRVRRGGNTQPGRDIAGIADDNAAGVPAAACDPRCVHAAGQIARAGDGHRAGVAVGLRQGERGNGGGSGRSDVAGICHRHGRRVADAAHDGLRVYDAEISPVLERSPSRNCRCRRPTSASILPRSDCPCATRPRRRSCHSRIRSTPP